MPQHTTRLVCPANLTDPEPMRAVARTRMREQLDQVLARPVTWLPRPPSAGKPRWGSS